MVSVECAELGTEMEVMTQSGAARATVVDRPFFDPKKKLAIAYILQPDPARLNLEPTIFNHSTENTWGDQRLPPCSR